MIRTQVFEAILIGPGKIEETELGWVNLPEVPIEKKAPQPVRQGEMPPQPLVIKVFGESFFVIGHSWNLMLSPPPATVPMADSEAHLILVVQRVPPMPSGLVRADSGTLGQLEKLMPPPGGSGPN